MVITGKRPRYERNKTFIMPSNWKVMLLREKERFEDGNNYASGHTTPSIISLKQDDIVFYS